MNIVLRFVLNSSDLSFLNISDIIWRALKCNNIRDFKATMIELQPTYMKAFEYVSGIHICHWSKHKFDQHVKSDHVTNNIFESVNHWIEKFRDQPIITFFENRRRKIMKRMRKRLEEAAKWETNNSSSSNEHINRQTK